MIENITTELGFAVGDQITEGYISIYSTVYVPVPVVGTAKTIGFQSSVNSGLVALARTAGTATILTPANWKYALIAERGW